MYELLITKLTAAGYEHYEISNFAKPGFRSRHNSSYWDGTPYIGIGAAAHSYDINSRSWNIADIHQYIKGMEEGQRIFEQELIDEHTRYNDAITVALRTKDGLNLNTLSESHKHYCLENAQKFIDDKLLTYEDHRLRLTRKGLFVSDMIMSELIWVD
jgi:oxygen-independent coproporphyrinogen-3 oxidase